MSNILLLGSDRSQATGIRSLLRQDGHRVTWLRQAERWRDAEQDVGAELIVAGAETIDDVLGTAQPPARAFPAPLLVISIDADLAPPPHLDDRLVDRIESPFMSEDFLARADALIRARAVILRTHHGSAPKGSDAPAAGSGSAVARAGGKLRAWLGTRVPKFDKPLSPYLEVASRLADWADRRDAFEPGHAERVAAFSAIIAEALDMPDGEASALLRAAVLHDIGKVALPVEILRQPGPLREEQLRLIRTHPERGARLLRALDGTDTGVAEAIRCHHEQPDGAGYYGVRRDDVPRSALVLGVAEAYDAMTSTKLGTPMAPQQAIAVLRDQAGAKFDSDSVEALADAICPPKTRIPLSPGY